MDVAILETQAVNVSFQALNVLNGVTFGVATHSITSLVGPNGAGKTTVFNVISGLIRPSSGEINFDGRRLDGLRADQIARTGIGRTFQDPRVFGNLSVLDNVLIGARLRASKPFRALVRDCATREEWANARDSAEVALSEFDLQHRLEEKAGNLSFAEQRFLSFARVLAGAPKLLLLDEPTVGLDPPSIAIFKDWLRALIARKGISVLLVEHNMDVVLDISDQVHLLAQGRVVTSGPPAEIRKDQKMIEAYLGDEYALAS
jgi:ABC-type branched-subunit amino acid transport system ATPase component